MHNRGRDSRNGYRIRNSGSVCDRMEGFGAMVDDARCRVSTAQLVVVEFSRKHPILWRSAISAVQP